MSSRRGAKKLISSDEAHVAAKQPTSPCSDCPFRRDALPGWLGGGTVDEWVELAHGEGVSECHTLVGPGSEKYHCAGLAIYRANVCKSPRDPLAFRLPVNREIVFSFGEFKKHHEGKKKKHA